MNSGPMIEARDDEQPEFTQVAVEEIEALLVLLNAAREASAVFSAFATETDEARIPNYDDLNVAALRLADAVRAVEGDDRA